jgi:formylglycine-generating enzyme required for sulfatase activity
MCCSYCYGQQQKKNAAIEKMLEMVFVQGNDTINSFNIGKYEVTNGLWKAVMGNTPSKCKKGNNYPVEFVSWNDVQEFLSKLNEITGKNYRLPMETEWEYAARGGNASKGYEFSGSNNVNDIAWYSGNSKNSTHPVGTKSPNELGLYDMSGNVYEWCHDLYHSNERAICGSCWSYDDLCNLQLDNRINGSQDMRIDSLGFRIVLSYEES